MKSSYAVVVLALLLSGISADAEAQQSRKKRAQTGMKFLSVATDARSAAMGDAMTAIEQFGGISMFHNPAGMARMETFSNLTFGQVNYIAEIKYNYGTLAIKPANGRFGVFGLSMLYVDYGDIQATIFDGSSETGYRDVGTIRPWGMSFGVGYAKEVSEQFSFGGNVKYVGQSLGSAVLRVDNGAYPSEKYQTNVVAYDFGIMYKTGFESLVFAMTARNFSPEVTYVEEAFELPLTFKVGLSMDMLDLSNVDQTKHNLVFAVEAERPRDYDEMIKVGAEYLFMKRFALRAGYAFPSDEQGISAGFGLQQTMRNGRNLGIDYSFTEFGVFNSVHRLSASISF
jgi:hypothetical protein